MKGEVLGWTIMGIMGTKARRMAEPRLFWYDTVLPYLLMAEVARVCARLPLHISTGDYTAR